MFCDQCGNALTPGQRYCTRCGKQVVGDVGPVAMQHGRVRGHIRFLGILWIALSALNVLGGAALVLMANTIFARWSALSQNNPGLPAGFLHIVLGSIGAFILIKAAAGFLAGWGLLQHESWARILAIVLGILSLFNLPFGTALGIYTLWVLLPSGAEDEYLQLRRAA
ncbi:MAG TPA: zinc ribbon domain-containing protein [Terriglobales bacterium]|nr:zinc ribbon domain-containing protein [Terriglobales bacterium]